MVGALMYCMMAQEKGGDVSQLLKKKIQLKKYIEERKADYEEKG